MEQLSQMNVEKQKKISHIVIFSMDNDILCYGMLPAMNLYDFKRNERIFLLWGIKWISGLLIFKMRLCFGKNNWINVHFVMVFEGSLKHDWSCHEALK